MLFCPGVGSPLLFRYLSVPLLRRRGLQRTDHTIWIRSCFWLLLRTALSAVLISWQDSHFHSSIFHRWKQVRAAASAVYVLAQLSFSTLLPGLDQTSQQAELYAVFLAWLATSGDIVIASDCQNFVQMAKQSACSLASSPPTGALLASYPLRRCSRFCCACLAADVAGAAPRPPAGAPAAAAAGRRRMPVPCGQALTKGMGTGIGNTTKGSIRDPRDS